MRTGSEQVHRSNFFIVISAISLLLPLILLLFSGCGRPDFAERLTFAVGGAPAELDVWEEIVADFEAETGIEVELLRQPTDTDMRRQELITSLRAGRSDPDVFLLDVAWLGQFAASQWLEPLDQAIEQSDLELDVFFQRVIELADIYQGQLVALPVYVDAGLLYYRRDLLEKHDLPGPPETWEQLLDYSLQVQAAEREEQPDFYGYVWQGAQYEGLICNWLEIAVSAGGGIFDNDRLIIDSPANRKATDWLRDFIHQHKISPPNTYTDMKEEPVRSYFQQGKALFQRNWPYAWSLHQEEDSPVKGKVGIAPLPSFPEGSSTATLGGWHIGVSAFAGMKEESFIFLEYILSSETQKRMALELGWNPGRRDIYEDPELLSRMPHLEDLREVFAKAYPRPTVPYYTMISEALQRRLNAVLSRDQESAAALAAAHQEIKEIITRYE